MVVVGIDVADGVDTAEEMVTGGDVVVVGSVVSVVVATAVVVGESGRLERSSSCLVSSLQAWWLRVWSSPVLLCWLLFRVS